MKRDETPSGFKLKKLKEARLMKLEKNFLDVQLRGQDHYVYINEHNKAQVISRDGNWVTEHIRTAVLKYNFEVDKVKKMKVKDFSFEEIKFYENKYLK